MSYTAVIGLEIHAELQTQTKIFCACANSFGEGRNSQCCPVCTAQPGALPVLNREAVEAAIAAGLALGCEIAPLTAWDRKNYFYPDLPKAYQITQLYAPVCLGGGLAVGGRFIRLNHIHLEEDAGKLVHAGAKTRIDLNRAGVPLLEIVTEPDMRSADEAAAFVEKIRRALVYAGVCDGKMEQGSLRVDANVSVMPEGASVFGTRTETKNLNSFRFMKGAIAYEIERQTGLLESGRAVVQETRRYDAELGRTFSMRSKENAHDYRYFPDPDIPAVRVAPEDVARIRARLPESPEARLLRYTGDFGLSETDAETLLAGRAVSDFYDAVVAAGADPKSAANLIRGEVLRRCGAVDEEIPIPPGELAQALRWAAEGKLSNNGLKETAALLFTEGKCAAEIVEAHGLLVAEDAGLLTRVVNEVLQANPRAVEQYRAGDGKVIGFFMGQCARQLKGKAMPQSIQNALRQALEAFGGAT